MAVTSGFFSSIKNDRKYDAKDIGDLFEGLIPNGVFSGIGNAFTSKMINQTQASISSGLIYFNGYYFYNDGEIIIDIPEQYLVGIELEKFPQLDFPKGNRLYYDENTIKVVAALSTSPDIKEIRVEGVPQLDYPKGNKLYYDTQDLRVVASFGGDDGWVYVAVQFNEESRNFSIEAIGIEDYDPSKHLLIARSRRLDDDVEYRSLVGSSYTPIIYSYKHHYHNEETGTDEVTGSLYIDDLLDKMNDEEEEFKKSYFEEKTSLMTDFWRDEKWYLHQSGSQYSRIRGEINSKISKALVLTEEVDINADQVNFYAPYDLTNHYIDIFAKPNTLTINSVEVIDSVVIVKFDKCLQKYKISARIQSY